MRILEARDGFIRFESEEKVALSSFLQIDGFRRYIAQVIKITRLDLNYVGYAKLIFVYDGSLNEYDNSLPDVKSEVRPFSFDIFSKSMEAETPVLSGHFLEDEIPLYLDRKCFDKKLLISIDNPQNLEKLIANLKQEFATLGNVLVIDTLGIMSGRKYTASVDFKLPLNTEALEFIYEDCLNDATSDSKSLVKEIFSDLAEYSKTVPFLPFATLKTIVDDMVDHSHVFKLLVLKNKLMKFDNLGYFAKTSSEAENLGKILAMKDVVLDLSKLDSQFQNRYLSLVYSALNKLEAKPQVFILASNSINKKSIKTILTTDEIPAAFATHSRFKYINEIKQMFTDFIVEPSFANNEVFKLYKTFLEAMPKDTYLITGQGTNFIPLVSLNKEFVSRHDEIVIDETNEKNVVEQDFSELEEALEVTVEKDEQTEAIDKKSEDLIEKVADDLGEVSANEVLNIFDSEEDEAAIEEAPVEEPIDIPEQGDFTVVHSVEENEEQVPDEIEISKDMFELAAEAEAEADEEAEAEADEESDFVNNTQDDVVVLEQEAFDADIIDDAQTEIVDYEPIEEASVQEESAHLSQAESDAELLLSLEDEMVDSTEVPEEEPDIIPIEDTPIETSNIEVIPITNEEDFDEIVELDTSEISDEDIIVDFGDEEIEVGLVDPDVLEKEIAEDVDKVFTTIKEDTISDSDLDFIDELNNDSGEDIRLEEISESSDFEELPEMIEENSDEPLLEPLQEINESTSLEEDEDREVLQTRNASTPMVPVYEAEIPQEDLVVSDSFEQGDTVTHAKYGVGVVEKMIKYGAKTLYSINFDNVGRRLLDPTLTEIKKA